MSTRIPQAFSPAIKPFLVLVACLLTTLLHPGVQLHGEDPASAPTRDKAFYGINADPLWGFSGTDPKGDSLPAFVRMLKESQCGSVRIPIRWLVLEPKRGEWDFTAMDHVLEAIPAHIEILGTLMSVPSWANGRTAETAEGWFDSYPPQDVTDWQRAVFEIVSRYKHRIKHWEIWNEQNGVDFYRPRPDARAYTELLKAAHGAAKKADPKCVVVLGGLQMNGIIANPWSEVKVPDFLEDLYKAGAQPFFDVCNIHPYALPQEGAEHMMRLTRDTLALMARYGDAHKSLWITEVGCGAASREAEAEQAKLLRETYQLAAAEPRIGRVYWFLLRDMKKDLLGPEASMGVFRYDGEGKPALEAFVKGARGSGSSK